MDFYIDPGTGSMLFAILIGILGAAQYAARMALVKIRFILSGGKNVTANENKIPFVIFSDNKRYWNVFKPICEEMDRRGIDIVYLTASEDDPALEAKLPHLRAEFLGEGNKAFAKLNLLRATLVLSTTPGLDVYQWKRSKDVDYYVHILHAAGEVVLYRMFGLDYYDAVLLGGARQIEDIRALEHLRDLPEKELKVTGIPYMDEMVARLRASQNSEAASSSAKGTAASNVEINPSALKTTNISAEASSSPKNTQRTILLAPSWGPSAIFSKFGTKLLDELLKTDAHIIVRPHPQSFTSEKDLIEGIMKQYPASDRLEWNRDVDNFEVLKRSDILISDFSGVVFDFTLVYDKPVIYADTHFDTAVYDAWWLKQDKVWTQTALERIGLCLTEENMDHITELVDACLTDERLSAGRQEVRDEIWQCFGTGTKETVDYLESKLAMLTAAEQKRTAQTNTSSDSSDSSNSSDLDSPAPKRKRGFPLKKSPSTFSAAD